MHNGQNRREAKTHKLSN